MKKQEYNQNILKITLDRQKMLQRKVGTNWWYENSKTHFVFTLINKICFYFSCVLYFIIISDYAYMLGRFSSSSNKAEETLEYTSRIWTFCILSIVLVSGYILSVWAKKRYVPGKGLALSRISYIVTAVGCVGLAFSSYDVLVLGKTLSTYAEAIESNTTFKVYMQLVFFHLLPLLLLLFTTVMFHIMRRCNSSEVNVLYDRMISSLYADYTARHPEYTEEMWLEYLNSYEYTEEEPVSEKRSKKSRRRKEKKSADKTE